MDNLQDKIGQLLSDPSAMEQLKSLGAMMGLDTSKMSAGNFPQQNAAPAPPAPPVPAAPAAPVSGINLSNLFGNADTMAMITRVMPLLQSLNREDETTRLLDALAPFLGVERRDKLEKAKKIVQLFKILPLLKNSGIF